MKQNTDFECLARSAQFAGFTKILMKLTKLAMALNSPDGTIRQAFGPNSGSPLCLLIRNNPEGLRRCTNCDKRHYKKALLESRPHSYKCHAGFFDMAIPVFVQGRHVGTISSGQILPDPPNEAGFNDLLQRLVWLKTSESVLKRAYYKSPYMPKEKIKYVMELLELFANHLCDSLQKIRDLEARLERDEFRLAKDFIDKNFQNPSIGLSDIADYVGLSPAHFSHTFKQHAGKPLVRHIQERRISEAKELILSTEYSITKICFSCGFNSLTNFNRVFRNIEHCSPRQFKEKMEKEFGRTTTSKKMKS